MWELTVTRLCQFEDAVYRHVLHRVTSKFEGKVRTRGQSTCVAGGQPMLMFPSLLGEQMAWSLGGEPGRNSWQIEMY